MDWLLHEWTKKSKSIKVWHHPHSATYGGLPGPGSKFRLRWTLPSTGEVSRRAKTNLLQISVLDALVEISKLLDDDQTLIGALSVFYKKDQNLFRRLTDLEAVVRPSPKSRLVPTVASPWRPSWCWLTCRLADFSWQDYQFLYKTRITRTHRWDSWCPITLFWVP